MSKTCEKFTRDRNSKPSRLKYSDIESKTSNDPAYYNKNAEDYKLATQVPWVEATGLKLPGAEFVKATWDDGVDTSNATMPGIMTASVSIGPGRCGIAGDPVNRAFSELMADIYAKTSSSTVPFQATDLAMYVTSQTSIAALIATLKRAMKARNMWVNRNIYYPIYIEKALDFERQDLIANYPTYVSRLNAIIRQFNNIKVLKIFDVYSRQYSLFTNAYVDEDSPYGQLLFFKLNNVYEYVDTDHAAHYVDLDTWFSEYTTSTSRFESYLTLLEKLLENWYNTQDLFYISGYLQRAYKDGEFFIISEFTEDDILEPVTDEGENKFMFEQLMNATIVGALDSSDDACDITQDIENQVIFWTPKLSAPSFGLGNTQLLRLYEAEPSADEIMECTRLMAVVYDETMPTPSGSSATGKDIISCGPELVTKMSIFYLQNFEDGREIGEAVLGSNFIPLINNSPNNSFTVLSGAMEWIVKSQAFRYAPRVWVLTTYEADEETLYLPMGLLYDQYNVTGLSRDALVNLNRVALLSLYKIPY